MIIFWCFWYINFCWPYLNPAWAEHAVEVLESGHQHTLMAAHLRPVLRLNSDVIQVRSVIEKKSILLFIF